MDQQAIMIVLEKIFGEVIDNSNIRLNSETVVSELEGWDSFSQIRLILLLEKSFNVRFTSQEIQSWANVGELCLTIHLKTIC